MSKMQTTIIKDCRKQIAELQAKNKRYEELLRIARGSDFKWPESFKAQVDEALLKEVEDAQCCSSICNDAS